MTVYPVIMCGGSGHRLWPASRPSHPKQFIRLLGEHSSFQQTVLRVCGITAAQPPLIIAGMAHADSIRAQLAEIGVEATLLLEPEARDSAPAIAAAALWVAERDPDGIAVVVAADHHIPDMDAFRKAAEAAAELARSGLIVTLGVKPTEPSSAYGYIMPAGDLGEALEVRAFVEKPEAEMARAYVAAGYLWNSGNFIAPARTLIDELEAHAPAIVFAVREAYRQSRPEGRLVKLGHAFCQAPKVSIDYAVMEKTRLAAVLPVDFGWSDLGAWDAVWAASSQDDRGNVVKGDALLVNSKNCLVRARGDVLVTAIGVHNLAIVVEEDAILICDLSSSQSVKTTVDMLKAAGRPQFDRAPASVLAAGTGSELEQPGDGDNKGKA